VKKLIKWETIILMFLVILLLFYTIGINSKHKRYIDEDKEQFISKIDSLIDKSKDKIDSIITNNDEAYIKDEDIEILMMYHHDLKRSVFGFKKKTKYINKDVSDGLQKVWDKYNYEEEINLEDTIIYYEDLLKRIGNKENLMLKDEDVHTLKGIYELYIEIRKDINKVI